MKALTLVRRQITIDRAVRQVFNLSWTGCNPVLPVEEELTQYYNGATLLVRQAWVRRFLGHWRLASASDGSAGKMPVAAVTTNSTDHSAGERLQLQRGMSEGEIPRQSRGAAASSARASPHRCLARSLCHVTISALPGARGRGRFWLTDGDFSGLGPSAGWIMGGINRDGLPGRSVPWRWEPSELSKSRAGRDPAKLERSKTGGPVSRPRIGRRSGGKGGTAPAKNPGESRATKREGQHSIRQAVRH